MDNLGLILVGFIAGVMLGWWGRYLMALMMYSHM